MSLNHTANYQLSQWEPSDAFVRVDFNQDNANIDAALHTLDLAKANRTELVPLQALDNQKADRTDVAALSTEITLRCRMKAGVYQGDGKYSQHIDVGFPVEAVLIENDTGSRHESWNSQTVGGIAVKGCSLRHGGALASVSGNGFEVYPQGEYQGNFNGEGRSYSYIAWGK